MPNNKIESIRQALAAAENNIREAKRFLGEIEGVRPATPLAQAAPVVPERPGIVGIYDGEKMTTQSGEVYPVPGNYASKSLLVVGDTLKLYEENNEKRFKQIEHVKRHKTSGLLVKKDGKFRAITPEGSYKVLTEAINHFNGEVGDEVVLYLPAGNLTSPYAAIETIHKKTSKTEDESEEVEEDKIVPKPETPKAKDKPASKEIKREVKETPAVKVSVSEPKAAPKPESVPETAETPVAGEEELS